MATNYSKYINSKGTHYISNSGSDENGNLHGGKAGDQNGKEWRLRSWYSRPWTCVLRHPDATVRRMLAEFGIDAALNNKIGYDQWQRYTYWDALTKSGYKPANVKTACEADCTAGVTANVKAVGHLLGIPKLANIAKDTRSSTMRARFKAADFKVLTEKKYLSGPDYLLPGDILLYDNHHAATNITKGKKAGELTAEKTSTVVTGLKKSDKGTDVTAMQRALLVWDANCLPKWGADGDFGSETETALRAFQQSAGLTVNGIYDKATEAALKAVGGTKYVEVTGGSVNVRTAPGLAGKIIGQAASGDKLTYQGEAMTVESTPWYLVIFKNQNGWISGNLSKLT